MHEKITTIIRDLERCAKQNEADARTSSAMSCSRDLAHASGVAGEQRRMIRILQELLRVA